MNSKKSFAVLGSGAWGTALAFQLARSHPDRTIFLWGFDPKEQKALIENQCNMEYFPDDLFPPNLKPVIELSKTLENCEGILIAVPSIGFADTVKNLPIDIPVIAATKGLDPKTGSFLHTLVNKKQNYSVLSGPSFASEVMAGLPTAVTIASEDINHAKFWQKHFHNDYFRVYTSDDIIGVQLGGSVKNVMAIATGISDGLGFGANSRAALITRGLNEMMRLNEALGGKQATLLGMAGIGDLILTCTDNQSRNRRFGMELGKGKSIEEAQKIVKQVVEGYYAAKLVDQLAERHHVDMPLCSGMYEILYKNLPVKQAFQELLSRAPKEE